MSSSDRRVEYQERSAHVIKVDAEEPELARRVVGFLQDLESGPPDR